MKNSQQNRVIPWVISGWHPLKGLILPLLVLILAGAKTPPESPSVQEVNIEVYGLVCSSCALGMKASFKRLDFVHSVAYLSEKSSFTLSIKPDRKTDLNRVVEMVRKNGFTHGKIRLKGKFRMETSGKTDPASTAFYLVAGNLTQKLSLEGFSEKLKGTSTRDALYEFEGRVEPPGSQKKLSKAQTAPEQGLWRFFLENKQVSEQTQKPEEGGNQPKDQKEPS